MVRVEAMYRWHLLPMLYRPLYIEKLASPGYTSSVVMGRLVTTYCTYICISFLGWPAPIS